MAQLKNSIRQLLETAVRSVRCPAAGELRHKRPSMAEFLIQALKQRAKKMPGVPLMYHSLKNLNLCHRSKNKVSKTIFTDIFKSNSFGGKDSVSGPGSDLYQTRIIIKELPALFRDLGVSTLLDIPCGDFHWMNQVISDGIDYIGADIVDELIQNNKRKYERRNVSFRSLDIIEDELPRVDLVFCRDCLVHLSFKQIFSTFHTICNSGSMYLLTTTFPLRKRNRDVFTGQWRPVNLQIPPFNFPEPILIINEACPEAEGAYSDKSLGLWRIDAIQKSLAQRPLC